MLALKKSRKRRLACSPASTISRGTSIADVAAGRRSVVGTMIASAWLGSAGLLLSSSTASASTVSSNLIPMPAPRVWGERGCRAATTPTLKLSRGGGGLRAATQPVLQRRGRI
jgi:hypothetical protein